MDKLTPEQRSKNMRNIRSKNTTPEVHLRSLLHRLGYRFRLHRPDLPGKPDIVFPGRRKIIFVQGCFWHQHENCREGRVPDSRRDYWKPKLARTIERDNHTRKALQAVGWDVCTVWECALQKNTEALLSRIKRFLDAVEPMSSSDEL